MTTVHGTEIKYNDMALQFALYSLNEIIRGTEYRAKGLEAFIKGSLGGVTTGIEDLVIALQSAEDQLFLLFYKTKQALEVAGVQFPEADAQGAISTTFIGTSGRIHGGASRRI